MRVRAQVHAGPRRGAGRGGKARRGKKKGKNIVLKECGARGIYEGMFRGQ